MTTLNPSQKQKLARFATINTLEPLEEKISASDQTRKILFQLTDKSTIETTLMSFRNPNTNRLRRTVCVSSQVGCSIGCRFCATGQQGFIRNLSIGEISQQILYFLRRFGGRTMEHLQGKGGRSWVTNVVFMGMGEPLANFNNVRQAIGVLNSSKGMGLGLHQITLSTAGLVPQIRRIIKEDLQFELAVSLHAANDKLRNFLVPINRTYPLDQLIAVCKEYTEKKGQSIYFEYALFDGINDSLQDADDLVRRLATLNYSVNLILGNRIPKNDFQPSLQEKAYAFQNKLINCGIRTMLRVSRGADIEAGCGQLRSRWLHDQS